MNELNVVISFPLDAKYIDQIAAVDPRIRVKEAGLLVQAELGFPTWLKVPWLWDTSLTSDIPAKEASHKLDGLLQDAEVLYAGGLPLDLLSRMPHLQWVQSVGAGIDDLLRAGVLETSIVVTTTKGIQAITIPEWALGLMFMLAKQAPRLFNDKQNRHWERYVPIELHGKTLAVVGLGNIGKGLATRAKSLGMRVIATRRSTTKRESRIGVVDIMYPPQEMQLMLSQSDFVVICLPLTPETTKIIGENELRAMKPTSYMVTISRGGIIDEAALIKALKEGWIAGAGLDVFETEPLSPDSELWDLPNVILSPHMAGSTPLYHDRATQLFCDNLERYLARKPLINVADKNAAY
ncbi:D-2-hydroxyacid dehydrogenase [Chloroflexota bacterium]